MASGLKIVSLAEAEVLGLSDQVLDVASCSFSGPEFALTSDPTCPQWTSEMFKALLSLFFPNFIEVGLSFVAVVEQNQKVAGVVFVDDATSVLPPFEAVDPSFVVFSEFRQLLMDAEKVLGLEHRPRGDTFHLFIGAVAEWARRGNVLTRLLDRAIQEGKAAGYKRCIGIAISAYSNLSVKKLGMKEVGFVPYKTWVYRAQDGTEIKPYENVHQPHDGVHTMEMVL